MHWKYATGVAWGLFLTHKSVQRRHIQAYSPMVLSLQVTLLTTVLYYTYKHCTLLALTIDINGITCQRTKAHLIP